jgi:DtxR family Mn-dependent transcriptional regulator
MERDGLLRVAKDRHLALTETGRALATRVMRKHRSVERRLFELLGRPDRCPHGDPIPGLAELA